MYNGFVHAHSGLRWVVLILLIVAIVNAAKSQSSGNYTKKDKMINLFTMISLHIQLLIGLGLYFTSDKVRFISGMMGDTFLRFFAIEHIFGMIVAITLVTIGRSKAEKKLEGSRDKHRKIMKTYLYALIIILLTIPWPFREALGSAWM